MARGNSNTFRHFQVMNISKTTTYTVMAKCDQGIPRTQKSGNGHIRVENVCILGQSHEKGHGRKNGPSLAPCTAKFNISQQYGSIILRFKIILRCRHRNKDSYVPKIRQIKIYALEPEKPRKAKNTCRRKRELSMNSLEFGTDRTVIRTSEGQSI